MKQICAFEGIALLQRVAKDLNFFLQHYSGLPPAMGLVSELLVNGLANAHDVAVFTAQCVCVGVDICLFIFQ
jgi:hypothetical protein